MYNGSFLQISRVGLSTSGIEDFGEIGPILRGHTERSMSSCEIQALKHKTCGLQVSTVEQCDGYKASVRLDL